MFNQNRGFEGPDLTVIRDEQVRRRFREEYDRKAQIIIQSRMFESKKVQWCVSLVERRLCRTTVRHTEYCSLVSSLFRLME